MVDTKIKEFRATDNNRQHGLLSGIYSVPQE